MVQVRAWTRVGETKKRREENPVGAIVLEIIFDDNMKVTHWIFEKSIASVEPSERSMTTNFPGEGWWPSFS